MSDESIGGFFVDLGIKTDGSIEKGIGQFEGLTNSVSRLIGTIRNVSAASFALATVTSTMETAELHAAELLNTNAETLTMWKIAASTATADSKGFISSLTSLEEKMQGLKFGKVDQGLAESLSRLNIGYQQLADMDLTQRVKLIFERATELQDQDQAERLIGQILGDSGMKMFNYMKLQGVSLDELLLNAQQSVFTGTESKIKAMSFTSELNALKSSLKELSALTGSELGGIFEPLVAGLNDLIQKHHDLIQSGIIDTFEGLKNVMIELSPQIKAVGDSFADLIIQLTDSKDFEEALKKISNSAAEFGKDFASLIFETTADTMIFFEKLSQGDFKGAAKAYKDWYAHANQGVVDMFTTEQSFEEEFNAYQKKMQKTKNLPDNGNSNVPLFDYINKGAEWLSNQGNDDIDLSNVSIPKSKPDNTWWKPKKSIEDGIVKSNGDVINISPDDWVFAMKDPSNLTGGISPESIKSLVSKTVGSIQNNVTENITVNQTFNITGTNNLPQTIKQQAQKGIYDGVGDLLQKSSTRLQLMSGIK
jgi:hypothetical protein